MNVIEYLKGLLGAEKEEGPVGIRIAAVSHKGEVRGNNEDNFYVMGTVLPLLHEGTEGILEFQVEPEGQAAAAVFDGMGGEAAGELASFTAADKMKELSGQRIFSEESVKELCADLNRSVTEAAEKEKYTQIGTTAVLFFTKGNQYIMGNVGDSPFYLFRKGKLTLLSEAHVSRLPLELQGFLGRKPALTQFLGMGDEEVRMEPFVKKGTCMPGDRVLLCSDGLTDMAEEKEIENILREEKETVRCVERLLETALDQGGRDNITIILCDITE